MAPCVSTGRELSFECSRHKISSADSKVRVTLQNSIKYSGSERVNVILILRVISNRMVCVNAKHPSTSRQCETISVFMFNPQGRVFDSPYQATVLVAL